MFIWVSANVQHIGKHDVSTGEAEYVVRHARTPWPEETGDAKLRAWGQTADGRYLQVVYILPADEQIDYESLDVGQLIALSESEVQPVYVIHARDLTAKEKTQYRRRSRR